MLALYSLKLSYEWYTESDEGGGEEETVPEDNPEAGTYAKVAQNDAETYESGRGGKGCCGNYSGGQEVVADPAAKPQSARDMVPSMEIDSPDKPQEDVDKADKDRQKTLFIIAFIGSVDDLTLFVPMLVGKGFDLAQLMLGACAAASTIVCLCLFIGQCKPIADCLSS